MEKRATGGLPARLIVDEMYQALSSRARFKPTVTVGDVSAASVEDSGYLQAASQAAE